MDEQGGGATQGDRGTGRRQDDEAEVPVRLTAWVSGHVQGVGFRWWTRCRALELGLVGSAANLGDGRVEVVAQGALPACEELLTLLREQPPRPAPPGAARSWYDRPGHVDAVRARWDPPRPGVLGFVEL